MNKRVITIELLTIMTWVWVSRKTYIGSEKMKRLGSKVNLVICQKSKIQDWIDHFMDNYGFKVVVYDLTNKKQFDEFMKNPMVYATGIINYELAWRRKELLKLHDFTLILDESSLIQNAQAKQTKFILKLQPKNVILLSGTPCSGKYENLWTQAHLLGWNISEELYNKQYVNWVRLDKDGFVHYVVDKVEPYKNVERLKRKLREHGAVFKKTEEVIDLPEQNFITVHVKKPQFYNKFMKHRIVTIENEEIVGDTLLTFRLRCRQLAGMYNEDKYETFKDILQSTNDRIIVFYNFTEELDKLKAICDCVERSYSEVNGSVKDLSAYEEKSDSVTLVQFQAGAKGLNLQKANKIVYFSPTEKCEDWMQSQKRIHRIGQKNTCYYYLLVAEGTIEEDIYDALQRGVDFTDDLFLKGVK